MASAMWLQTVANSHPFPKGKPPMAAVGAGKGQVLRQSEY